MLHTLQRVVNDAARSLSQGSLTELRLETPPANRGDVAICCSALAKECTPSRRPHDVATELAEQLRTLEYVQCATVAGVYVNVTFVTARIFQEAFAAIATKKVPAAPADTVMVEYLSPNTNKPLHLGHVRNGVLGSVLANVLEAAGHTVIRCMLINDRGEHICKSMLGYLRHGGGATPASTKRKGDHFVGDWYVAFAKDDAQRLKEIRARISDAVRLWSQGNQEINSLLDRWEGGEKSVLRDILNLVPDDSDPKRLISSYEEKDPEVTAMLLAWEQGDPEVRKLWELMNGWVYDGFAETMTRFGFRFDHTYYESGLYHLGKDQVAAGLDRNVFLQDEQGAVRFPMPEEHGTNPDRQPRQPKVLNADGTSGYLTQDIGTALVKAKDFPLDRSIYVVGNEQDYHFRVLFSILRALGYPWAEKCHHLSYAMVELPDGKMKSREGTVVDADNLVDDMTRHAAEVIRGNNPELPDTEVARRAEVIGLAAIKFYLLKFKATSKIMFDPKGTLSFEGDTGPYCLYAYARARSILAKAAALGIELDGLPTDSFLRLGSHEDERAGTDERACGLELMRFGEGIRKAADTYAPSLIADRMIGLSQAFSRFYKSAKVLDDGDEQLRLERLALVNAVADALKWSFSLLELEPLETM